MKSATETVSTNAEAFQKYVAERYGPNADVRSLYLLGANPENPSPAEEAALAEARGLLFDDWKKATGTDLAAVLEQASAAQEELAELGPEVQRRQHDALAHLEAHDELRAILAKVPKTAALKERLSRAVDETALDEDASRLVGRLALALHEHDAGTFNASAEVMAEAYHEAERVEAEERARQRAEYEKADMEEIERQLGMHEAAYKRGARLERGPKDVWVETPMAGSVEDGVSKMLADLRAAGVETLADGTPLPAPTPAPESD